MKKKSALLILMFISMFFIGNKGVKATTYLVCDLSDSECTPDNVRNQSSSQILVCLYEVDYKDNKTYYNYIFYYPTNKKYYAGSTIGSFKNWQEVGDGAFISDEAKTALYNDAKCPKKSYIETTRVNEFCFDNDDGACNSIKDKDFSDTVSSKLVEENTDRVIYAQESYSTSCDNKNICRYLANDGSNNYALLYINDNNQILFSQTEQQKKIMVPKGQRVELAGEGYHENYIESALSCPSELYMYKTKDSSYVYKWYSNSNALSDFEKKTTFRYSECNNEDEIVIDPIDYDCDKLFDDDLKEIVNEILGYVRIGVPILLIVLIVYDLASAVLVQDEKGLNNAKGKILKRVIVAVAIFFVPTLVNLIFNVANDVWEDAGFSTCGIGSSTESNQSSGSSSGGTTKVKELR